MVLPEQTAAEYVALSGQSFMQTVSAAARDAQDFVLDNPFLMGFGVVLAIVFFAVTRPRAN